MNAQHVVGDFSQNLQVSRPVRLKALFPLASYIGCADMRVSSVTCDSRKVQPQGAFVIVPGSRKDGAEFVPEAIRQGAVVLVAETPLRNYAIPQLIVPSAREALGRLSSALMQHPSRSLRMAAVTGTNGKTSVTWILRSIVQSAFGNCGLLGTIEYDDGVNITPSELTTPDTETLQPLLRRMVAHGCLHTVMEASSHALDQDRLAGCDLDAAVITNITQDHFDYHQSRKSYLAAKASITRLLKSTGLLIVNADDEGALEASLQSSHEQRLTYGLDQAADVRGIMLEESLRGSRFCVLVDDQTRDYSTPLIGRHQVSNCLAAIAVARNWGIPHDVIQRGLSRLRTIPGRLQLVDTHQGASIFVDYAHTPDALIHSVTHLRRLSAGRIFLVFGAGGDRDRSKRPLMGKAALRADVAVLTSDNPRSEEPLQIIHDIRAGMSGGVNELLIQPDRRAAIEWALNHCSSGDVILVAGKGHEREQVIGESRIPFDDAQVIREILDHNSLISSWH